MKFTESMLENYSQPLSTTEDAQCKHTIQMIRDALRLIHYTDDNKSISPLYSDTLSYSIEMRSTVNSRKIRIFVQGSYANNTNVRTESDVDIAVVEESVFTPEYRVGVTDANYNFSTSTSSARPLKDEVEDALKQKFGNDVERGNISVKVHGNTSRKDADTVPSRRHRDYRNDLYFNANNFIPGIIIYPDRGSAIVNYPEQHIENGKKKNTTTNGYYKKYVRIMKKMRYLMEDAKISAASNVGSFLLESMLWNISDNWYLTNRKFRKVYAFHELTQLLVVSKAFFSTWKEANGIKPLCADTQTKTPQCVC